MNLQRKMYFAFADKKISATVALLLGIAGICLVLSVFQNLALDFGEKFLVHRSLTRSVWIDRFFCWGRILIFCGILSALSCFAEKKKFDLILLSSLFCIVAVSFIFEPVTGDVKVFSAAARQSDFLDGNFIQNVYNSWELKGVGSRMTAYILYKIATIFSVFPSIQFEYALSAVYFLLSSVIIFASICLFFPEKKRESKIKHFLWLEIFLFSVQIMCRIQVEMTCTIFLLLAFSLYVNSVKAHKKEFLKLAFAGALVAITFFYKSVFILMAFSFLAACCLFNNKTNEKQLAKKCLYMIIGGTLALGIGIALILLINPYEFEDMKNASLFQTTLFSGGHLNIIGFIGGFVYASMGIPALFIAALLAISVIIERFKEKAFVEILLKIALWIVPAIIIILANKFFIYHYYIFIFPTVSYLRFIYIFAKKIIVLFSMNTKSDYLQKLRLCFCCLHS